MFFALALFVGLSLALFSSANSEAVDSRVVPQTVPDSALYTPEIEQKLTARCPVIKDYLAQTVRINELAALIIHYSLSIIHYSLNNPFPIFAV